MEEEVRGGGRIGAGQDIGLSGLRGARGGLREIGPGMKARG
jgi:hypothetical protein